MSSNRFQRGTGCFKCEVCRRSTRNSGQPTDSRLCFQCWELAGIQNAVWDGEEVSDFTSDIQGYLDVITGAGGDADAVMREFSDIFPKPAQQPRI